MNNNYMRQGQGGRNRNRNRNRHRGGGSSGSGGNKVFDSNGPDVKVRGTAQTVAEKYMQLGRDAQSSGDNVSAESYYQHAEHYYRVWASNQPPGASLIMSRKLGEEEFEDAEDGAGEEDGAEGQVQGEGALAAEGVEGGEAAPADAAAEGQGQPREGSQRQPRERFRPRWQRNRERSRPQDNATGDQGAAAAPAEQPQDGGQWEAPSFLQRPSSPRAADDSAPQGE